MPRGARPSRRLYVGLSFLYRLVGIIAGHFRLPMPMASGIYRFRRRRRRSALGLLIVLLDDAGGRKIDDYYGHYSHGSFASPFRLFILAISRRLGRSPAAKGSHAFTDALRSFAFSPIDYSFSLGQIAISLLRGSIALCAPTMPICALSRRPSHMHARLLISSRRCQAP